MLDVNRKYYVARCKLALIQSTQQLFATACTHCIGWRMHASEDRVGVLPEIESVEPGDQNISRHLVAALLHQPHGGYAHLVVPRHDSVRQSFGFDCGSQGLPGIGEPAVATLNDPQGDRLATLAQGSADAALTLAYCRPIE